MLESSNVVALLLVTDFARARAFYEKSLGLRFVADDGFALVFESGGRFLRLTKVEAFTPQPFAVIAWQVEDLSSMVEGLRDRGVTFERYPGMEQDQLGIWSVPDGSARVAWFKDPDGNVLSMVSSPVATPK